MKTDSLILGRKKILCYFFKVTDALFKSSLSIWITKIATKVDQVVDVFYLREFDGQKVDTPEQVEAVKEAITEILPSEYFVNG